MQRRLHTRLLLLVVGKLQQLQLEGLRQHLQSLLASGILDMSSFALAPRLSYYWWGYCREGVCFNQ